MATSAVQSRVASSSAYQAYWILHVGFAALPVIAGIDKFLHLLTNWDNYLAPVIARLSPIPGHTLMLIVCGGLSNREGVRPAHAAINVERGIDEISLCFGETRP